MKNVLLLFSLSCCLYLASSATTWDENSESESHLSPQLKTELKDLNADCLLKIFEKMEFSDLLKIAQMNQYFETLARSVYRRKMSSKAIQIISPFEKEPHEQIRESYVANSILIENYEIAQQTLRIFGAEIKEIQLNLKSISLAEHRCIHQLIGKYCSKSLTSIMFCICQRKSFDYFTVPLEKVENVSIVGELKSAEEGLKLNQIFPRLRRLDLFGINNEILDSDVLNVTFPRLTSFSYTISVSHDNYSHIEEFIKRNPQIQDLTLKYFNSFEYIKLASEHLTQLQSLELTVNTLGEHYGGPKIHFGSVKTLKMKSEEYDFTNIVGFDQLESLDLTSKDGVNFVTQFDNLTQLRLEQDKLTDYDILKLGEKLTNLKELTILSLADIKGGTISQLIRGNEKLEKLKLKLSYRCSTPCFKALQDRFSDDWTVTMDGTEIFMNKKLY